MAILSLDESHRVPALHGLIEEMRLRQKPEALVAAVASLLSEDVARIVLAAITAPLGKDGRIGRPPGYNLLFCLVAVLTGLALVFCVSMGMVSLDEAYGLSDRVPWLLLPVVIGAFVLGAIGGGFAVSRLMDLYQRHQDPLARELTRTNN